MGSRLPVKAVIGEFCCTVCLDSYTSYHSWWWISFLPVLLPWYLTDYVVCGCGTCNRCSTLINLMNEVEGTRDKSKQWIIWCQVSMCMVKWVPLTAGFMRLQQVLCLLCLVLQYVHRKACIVVSHKFCFSQVLFAQVTMWLIEVCMSVAYYFMGLINCGFYHA